MFLGYSPSDQKTIIDEILKILGTHSEKSKKSFLNKLDYLNNYGGEDNCVLVTGSYKTEEGEIEFHLEWYNFNQTKLHKHPYEMPWEKRTKPFMIGGLVYNRHSDNWGVHT